MKPRQPRCLDESSTYRSTNSGDDQVNPGGNGNPKRKRIKWPGRSIPNELRRITHKHMMEWRSKNPAVACALCEQKLGYAECDHNPAFIDIVERFFASKGIDVHAKYWYAGIMDLSKGYKEACDELRRDFFAFYEKTAGYRWLCQHCHHFVTHGTVSLASLEFLRAQP